MYPEIESKDLLQTPELEVDGDSHQALETTAKWTRFISLTVFICAGIATLIFLVGGLTMMQNMSRYSSRYSSFLDYGSGLGIGFIIVILIVVAILILWYNFLYKFSLRLREAIFTQEAHLLASAFKALKTHLIFSVVITALGILSSIVTTITTLSALSRY